MSSKDTKKEVLITKLGPNDVLLGRGTGPNRNLGNEKFRNSLKEFQTDYQTAKTMVEKRAIISTAIEKLKRQGGRFLQKVTEITPQSGASNSKSDSASDPTSASASSSESHRYRIVDGDAVFLKTRQTFRYLLRDAERRSLKEQDAVDQAAQMNTSRRQPQSARTNIVTSDNHLQSNNLPTPRLIGRSTHHSSYTPPTTAAFSSAMIEYQQALATAAAAATAPTMSHASVSPPTNDDLLLSLYAARLNEQSMPNFNHHHSFSGTNSSFSSKFQNAALLAAATNTAASMTQRAAAQQPSLSAAMIRSGATTQIPSLSSSRSQHLQDLLLLDSLLLSQNQSSITNRSIGDRRNDTGARSSDQSNSAVMTASLSNAVKQLAQQSQLLQRIHEINKNPSSSSSSAK